MFVIRMGLLYYTGGGSFRRSYSGSGTPPSFVSLPEWSYAPVHAKLYESDVEARQVAYNLTDYDRFAYVADAPEGLR